MKISKNLLFISVISASVCALFIKCGGDDSVDLIGNWVEQSDFEGVARSDAASFTIGNFGYVGTGYDGDDRLTDFWKYDSDLNRWTQVAVFPGAARNAAVAFAAAGKGYVGTGYTGEVRLQDFWEYDPAGNAWVQIADFAGSARYGAVAFSINDIGYVGTGYDGNYLKDFWAYDPSTGLWAQKTSFGGSKRRDAVGFVLDGIGYICTGINNGNYEKEFYAYDPSSDTWAAKRKIADVSDETYDNEYTIIRSNAVAFVLSGKAYVASGSIGTLKSDVWEYDALLDLWKQKTNFEGASRTDAVAFATDNGKAYVTTGKSSSSQFDDIWEFRPAEVYNNED